MSGEGNKFEATASATGYLFQCRYALYAGIRAIDETPNLEISIERFDDVAFEQGGEPVKLIQTKHHVEKKGNLTDASTDLWKTLRIWSERVSADLQAPFKTSFVLITTGSAPDGSAASYLRAQSRNEAKAMEILVKVADTSKSDTNKAAYASFLKLLPDARLSLLRAIVVFDDSPNVIDVHDEIASELRHAVKKEHLQFLVERLEGWWFTVVVRALSGVGPAFISVNAIESKIDELREGFHRDALPVDFADQLPPAAVIAELDKRPFVRQLRIIEVGTRRVELAIRDFYRAYEQRSRWAREDLLVDGEIENYERELVEAWEPRFEAAKDDLEDGCEDSQKIVAGQRIFKWVETEADFPLRTVRQRFLTHGSFHILANRHIIGWHPEHIIHVPPDPEDT